MKKLALRVLELESSLGLVMKFNEEVDSLNKRPGERPAACCVLCVTGVLAK